MVELENQVRVYGTRKVVELMYQREANRQNKLKYINKDALSGELWTRYVKWE